MTKELDYLLIGFLVFVAAVTMLSISLDGRGVKLAG